MIDKKILKNIFYSLLEKVSTTGIQLVSSIVLIRCLERQDYGSIGIAIGFFSLLLIINVSIEPIMFSAKDRSEIKFQLINFTCFNLIKVIVLTLVTMFTIWLMADRDLIFPLLSVLVLTVLDTLVSPIIISASLLYKQKVVTYMNVFRSILNLSLLAGLLIYPSLEYIFYKDLVVMTIMLFLWVLVLKTVLAVDLRISDLKKFDYRYVADCIKGYSIWVHFNSTATNIIYKVDTLILSFFSSNYIVGNYNVALNSANMANIAPGILAYQNKVAIKNEIDADKCMRISNEFIRFSTYLGIITLIMYVFFGDFYLKLVTGEDIVDETYIYMLCVVVGLVFVKTFSSPLMSFIAVKLSVKKMCLRIVLPTLSFSMFLYLISSMYFGAIGIAISNIIVSIFWFALVVHYVTGEGYRFDGAFSYKKDINYCVSFLKNRT